MTSAVLILLVAGMAEISITPPQRLPLGGYTERQSAMFEPGGQELMARALAIKNVAILTCEMLTIPLSLQEAVQSKMPKGKFVILVATHTHCAPDSQIYNSRMTMRIPGIAPFERKWLNWMSDRLAECTTQAFQSQAPVKSIEFQSCHAPWVRSRRPFGAVEPRATRLQLEVENSENPLVFDSFNAHPTLLGSDQRQLQGDWPGELMRRSGGLAVCGPIGDASPSPVNTDATPLKQVSDLGGALNSVLRTGHKRNLSPDFLWKSIEVPLGAPVPHPEFATRNKIAPALATSMVAKFAEPTATLRLMQIGKHGWLFVPGEPTSSLAREWESMAKRYGLESLVVVSHGGGWIGYILLPEDYDRGGYEASLSFHGRDVSQKLTAGFGDLLQKR